ncbi:hypothetical protein EON65_57350 [archaeon]|nr:MAG: hypothetical protein EON65_57350 [archaeon]
MAEKDFVSYILLYCREQLTHFGFHSNTEDNAGTTLKVQKANVSLLIRIVSLSPEEAMIYVKKDSSKVLSVKLLTTMSASAYKSLIKRFLILPCCADQAMAAPALAYIPEEYVLSIAMYLPVCQSTYVSVLCVCTNVCVRMHLK